MTKLLDRIGGPSDLHALSEDDLQRVAQEVREHIIDTVGEIGGHFGANLGACEIAVALHSLLESPRDKILWDVGHQAYPHKVLTGRRDELDTIRQYAASPLTTSWAPGTRRPRWATGWGSRRPCAWATASTAAWWRSSATAR
jgi:deoxyxylulose-5-phosphate synthase